MLLCCQLRRYTVFVLFAKLLIAAKKSLQASGNRVCRIGYAPQQNLIAIGFGKCCVAYGRCAKSNYRHTPFFYAHAHKAFRCKRCHRTTKAVPC